MKIEKSYNGWPASVRTVRGKKFYSQVGKTIPKPIECMACGHTLEDGVGLTYHAEEYGPTWEEYVAGAKSLCAYCHGMLHLRFRYPNRFRRYRSRLRTGWMPKVYTNIGSFMKDMMKMVDIPYHPDAKTGIAWMDHIEVKAYKGPIKVATVMAAEGIQVPDPACYPVLNDPKQYEVPLNLKL